MIDEEVDLSIPDFLIISAEDRLKAWDGIKLTDPRLHTPTLDVELWKQRENERKALDAEKRKAKNAAGLARLKEQRKGQKYDRKTKMWWPVTATVTA